MDNYFYGWYFRCQGQEETVAVIPAVHLWSGKGSCSVQVITQKESLYREFHSHSFGSTGQRGLCRLGTICFPGKESG